MAAAIKLYAHLTRVVHHFKRYDIEVPKALLSVRAKKPDLTDFPYPLPQRKKDYTCFCEGSGGVLWYGSTGGVTRYDEKAEMLSDKVMYFSAQRDLLDNNVSNLLADGDGVWVLTGKGVTHIEMVKVTMEKKAEILLKETEKYVSRHGMVSQKHLSEGGNLNSILPYGHSDNDGCYSAFLAIGEIFHYATLKREKGEFSEETMEARRYAQKISEATLLLMYIAGRGDGFVARTYLAGNEPVPDDGIFFKRNGDTAVCVNTGEARKRGIVGLSVKCDSPIPQRLRKIFEDEGFTEDDITYKADTSSDEITLHYMHLLVAHEFLGREDPEYDELLRNAVVSTTNHIVENGFALKDADNSFTTWARWDEGYFETPLGWADACLNASQMLMYLKIAIRITGHKKGTFQKTYNKLCKKGYHKLGEKHYDRFHQMCLLGEMDDREDLMYGDHELAAITYWGLTSLEEKEEDKEDFKKAIRAWRSSMAPEHNPGYDFLYALTDPENADLDEERIKTWFYRFGISRLAGGVSLKNRRDIPILKHKQGLLETSVLLPCDENFISKYDRNPYEYRDEDLAGIFCVESCYPYTFAYWIGRYFKFIEEADSNDK